MNNLNNVKFFLTFTLPDKARTVLRINRFSTPTHHYNGPTKLICVKSHLILCDQTIVSLIAPFFLLNDSLSYRKTGHTNA